MAKTKFEANYHQEILFLWRNSPRHGHLACQPHKGRRTWTDQHQNREFCDQETVLPWDTSFGSRACTRAHQLRRLKVFLSCKSLYPAVAWLCTGLYDICKSNNFKSALSFWNNQLRPFFTILPDLPYSFIKLICSLRVWDTQIKYGNWSFGSLKYFSFFT